MSDSALSPSERGLSRRIVEAVVALLLIALSVLVLWDSYGRGAGWEGGPQNGFFPARVGWLLLLAAGVVLFGVLRNRTDEVFVTWRQLRQVLRVFVPLLVFVVLIAWLGIYVASALFMALFMVTLGAFRPWTVALASLLVPLIAFWVFEIQFRVPLPKGPVESALGF
jgi:putative tricarboxylic transport membrane protein